jgi:hypothetical protein
VDLWDFYERVEAVIVDLRGAGEESQADAVETAIRGGATSGEVLGRLSTALRKTKSADSGLQTELDALAAWAKAALHSQF